MALGYEFTPIDIRIMSHPRALKAGIEAMGLWLYAMAYAKTHQTGGVIHREAALSAWGGKRNGELVKRLLASGLWSETEEGDFRIHNYEVKSGRGGSSSAERMARFRERKRMSSDGSDVTGDGDAVTGDASHVTASSISVSVSSSLSEPEGVQGETQTSNPPRVNPDIQPLWDHYVATRLRYGRKTRKREPNRDDRKAIVAALKSYDLETLKLAIEGLFLSDFHVEKDFTDIEYAMRDSNVEKFAGAAELEQRRRAPPPEPVGRSGELVDPAEFDALMAQIANQNRVA